jgi:hypothetical protein
MVGVSHIGLADCACHLMCSNRMRCDPTEHPLLCAEAPFLSRDARESMVQHLFESFSVPAVFLAKNPVLSSFALGRQTSLVVDMGHSGTVGMQLSCLLIHVLHELLALDRVRFMPDTNHIAVCTICRPGLQDCD